MISFPRYLIPTLYTNCLFVRTGLEICVLAVLIEALYLSERFISVLKVVIDKPVALANVVPLLAWCAPEVYLALPLVILIATYRVVLVYRENREFVALASGGQGTLPFLQFAGLLALAAFASSLLVSGWLAPDAKYAFRASVDAIRYQALTAGNTPGQFLNFSNYTIYAWPSDGTATRPIFVKQILDQTTYRIVNAKNIEIISRPSEGILVVGMLGVSITDFPNDDDRWIPSDQKDTAAARDLFCDNCGSQFRTFRSSNLFRKVDTINLVPTEPRGVSLDEWMTSELFGWTSPPAGRPFDAAATTEAMRRLARAMLCFLAPFIAWIALTATTRRSQAFALPLACAAIMGTDISLSQLVTRLSGIGPAILLPLLVAIVLGLLSILIAHMIIRPHLLISPALGRS